MISDRDAAIRLLHYCSVLHCSDCYIYIYTSVHMNAFQKHARCSPLGTVLNRTLYKCHV